MACGGLWWVLRQLDLHHFVEDGLSAISVMPRQEWYSISLHAFSLMVRSQYFTAACRQSHADAYLSYIGIEVTQAPLNMQRYLATAPIADCRRILHIRMGCSDMNYDQMYLLPRSQRLCRLCHLAIENVIHLFQCSHLHFQAQKLRLRLSAQHGILLTLDFSSPIPSIVHHSINLVLAQTPVFNHMPVVTRILNNFYHYCFKLLYSNCSNPEC